MNTFGVSRRFAGLLLSMLFPFAAACKGTGGAAATTGGTTGATTGVTTGSTTGGDTFTVGGTLTGLAAGNTLTVRVNELADITLDTNGSFTFTGSIPTATDYSVSIVTQPQAQSCTISGATGTVGNGNVTTVVIDCVLNEYTIAGTITGYTTSGLQLQLDGVETITPSGNGTFAFVATHSRGEAYEVLVSQQPATEHCDVSAGSGNVLAGNIASVVVNCTTTLRAIGGNVTGLLGSGLVARLNGGGDLPINGSTFAFAGLTQGTEYTVTLHGAVVDPVQTCAIANEHGFVGADAIDDIAITCTTTQFALSAIVTGLAAQHNDVANDLRLSVNTIPIDVDIPGDVSPLTIVLGNFDSGTQFTVGVADQPTAPGANCLVDNPTGTITDAAMVVNVTCTPTRMLAVQVYGDAPTLPVTVALDGTTDDVVAVIAGLYPLSSLEYGQAFSISTTPTVGVTCDVLGGAGTMGLADVVVIVDCHPTGLATNFFVGLTQANLLGRSLTLNLIYGASRDGFGNIETPSVRTIVFSGSGPFIFDTALSDATFFDVTIQDNPTHPWQTCSFDGGIYGGQISGTGATLALTCTTNTYSVGGLIAGLVGGGLELDLATAVGHQTIGVSPDGNLLAPDPFSFGSLVASGDRVSLSVQTSPTAPNQNCTVSSPIDIEDHDVGFEVTCERQTYPITITIIGAHGPIEVTSAYSDTLATGFAESSSEVVAAGATEVTLAHLAPDYYAYAISITSQAPGSRCTMDPGTNTGTVLSSAITNVGIHCTPSFSVGGTIVGYDGASTLDLQMVMPVGQPLSIIGAATTFAFTYELLPGESYSVSVIDTDTQFCTLTGGDGSIDTIAPHDVSSIVVTCVDKVFLHLDATGLTGTGATTALQVFVANEAKSETLNLFSSHSAPETSSFATASGETVTASITQQPQTPAQICQFLPTNPNTPNLTFSGPAISGASTPHVMVLPISCEVEQFVLTIDATGNFSAGPVPVTNTTNLISDTVTIAESGSYPFALTVASGDNYALTQPLDPTTCAFSAPTATVGNSAPTITATCSPSRSVTMNVSGLTGTTGTLHVTVGTQTFNINGDVTSVLFDAVRFADGQTLAATLQMPTDRSCSASYPSGAVFSGGDLIVDVSCSTTVSIGGTLLGFTAASITIHNGAEAYVPTAAGTFTMPTSVPVNAPYAVTADVATAAGTLNCLIKFGSGNAATNVTDIVVACPLLATSDATAVAIPDAPNTTGVTKTITFTPSETGLTVGHVAVRFRSLAHAWAGDVLALLQRQVSSVTQQQSFIINRMGLPSNASGENSDFSGSTSYLFKPTGFDDSPTPADSQAAFALIASGIGLPAGTYFPHASSPTASSSTEATWALYDALTFDTANSVSWAVNVTDRDAIITGTLGQVDVIIWPKLP